MLGVDPLEMLQGSGGFSASARWGPLKVHCI